MQVLNCTQQLQKVVPGEPLVEAARLVLGLNERKKVPLLNQFENNEKHLDGFSTRFYDYFSFAVILHQLNYVGVVHGLEKLDLVSHDLFKGTQVDPLHVMALDNLDCVELACFNRFGKLDPI